MLIIVVHCNLLIFMNKSYESYSCLQIAAKTKNIEIAQSLIEDGADVNETDE